MKRPKQESKTKSRVADGYSRRSLQKAVEAAREAGKQKDEKNSQTAEQEQAEATYEKKFPKA
jgi:hypothetical protein